MPHQKSQQAGGLPTKICPACKRPFVWRKKWEKVWETVIYCSEKCRSNKPKETSLR